MASLQDRPTSLDAERVLQFWHEVEFFIPFDLQQQDTGGQGCHLGGAELVASTVATRDR